MHKIFHFLLLILAVSAAKPTKPKIRPPPTQRTPKSLKDYLSINEDNNGGSEALVSFVQHNFVEPKIDFDVLVVGEISWKVRDIIDKFLRVKFEKPWHVRREINASLWISRPLQKSAIIFINISQFKSFDAKIDNKNYKHLKFVVYHEDKVGNRLPKFPVDRGKNVVTFAFFFFDAVVPRPIHLYTMSGQCNQLSITMINSYIKSRDSWVLKMQNYDNFKNFGGCPLSVYATHGVYRNKVDNSDYTYVHKLMAIVAKRRKFKMVIAKNGAKADVTIGTQLFFRATASVTTIFKEDHLQFLISPAEAYDSYEKLLLPFDVTIWWMLIGTFGAAFVVIFFVNLLSRKWQDIVYGEGVKMAAFNLVGTFFGIGQLKLPEANFPRSILLLFIVFCLIFRTAYQGVFFEMMTTDMRKALPETIDDLIKMKYEIRVPPASSKLSPYYDLKMRLNGKVVELPWNGPRNIYSNRCELLFSATRKTAIGGDLNFIRNVRTSCRREPLVLKEKILTTVGGIGVDNNHYLYDAVEEVTERLVPAGIMQHLYAFHKWMNYRSAMEENESGPQVFILDDLSFGFVIWLISCGVALLGFVLEITWYILKRFVRWIAKQLDADDSNDWVARARLTKLKFAKIHPTADVETGLGGAIKRVDTENKSL